MRRAQESPRQILYVKPIKKKKPFRLPSPPPLPSPPSNARTCLLACLGVQTPSLSQCNELGPLQAISDIQAILGRFWQFSGNFLAILSMFRQFPVFLGDAGIQNPSYKKKRVNSPKKAEDCTPSAAVEGRANPIEQTDLQGFRWVPIINYELHVCNR